MPPKNGKIVHCHACGKEIYRPAYKLKQAERHFCAPKCYAEYQKTLVGPLNRDFRGVETQCEQCGATFFRAPSLIKGKNHFCSRKCHDVWRSLNTRGDDNPKFKRVQLTCKVCGKMFLAKPSEVSRRVTCSRKCFGEHIAATQSGENAPGWQGGTMQAPCVVCGKVVQRYQDYIDKNNGNVTCGKKCFAIYKRHITRGKLRVRRANAICLNCGKGLDRTVTHVARYPKSFCDLKCMGKWRAKSGVTSGSNNGHWRGGWQSYYGPNWDRQRRRARQRDNHTCRHCGYKRKKGEKALDVHHIRAFREFGYTPSENENYRQANKLTNLITLCSSCHKKAEHGKISFQLNLL